MEEGERDERKRHELKITGHFEINKATANKRGLKVLITIGLTTQYLRYLQIFSDLKCLKFKYLLVEFVL